MKVAGLPLSKSRVVRKTHPGALSLAYAFCSHAVDANRFGIRIDMSHSVGGTQRIRGGVNALDSTVVDTIGR
jgi:hypothetical protein